MGPILPEDNLEWLWLDFSLRCILIYGAVSPHLLVYDLNEMTIRVIWNSRRAELLIISTLSLWACLRGCFMATWYVLFSPARCLFRPSPPSALVRLGVRFTLLFSCSSLLGLSVCSGSRWVIVAGGGWVSVSGLCLCSVKLLFPMKLRSGPSLGRCGV